MQTDSHSPAIFELRIDETAKHHLLTMASWGLIIGIVAIIKYILSVIEYIQTRNRVNYQFGDITVSTERNNLGGMIFTISIGLLVNYFLYQFSSLTKRGITNLSQVDLNRGFASLRTYFAIIGVLIIIALCLGTLGILMSGMNLTN